MGPIKFSTIDEDSGSLGDLVYNMIESRHALAFSRCHEATRKLELHKADVHQDEDSNLVVDTLIGKLKNAKAALQKAEDNMDVVDAVHVEHLRNNVSRLSLTI
ncbi:hypothetical protein GOP47_0005298 [Adiantum capillus-veneris]|uniref:Uncharacterized protein n=1 Tax=Adiantum capillus-veneris TaxID=13818 RepID=A0A9D4V598_ADICA|nr:hypothetical protein GOP47_0005298 [Adiantum capillus-veneris]